MNNNSSTRNSIALVGVAGRFPQARNVNEYWQNLCSGVETTTHFTEEELLAEGVPAERLRDPNYVKSACVLEDYDCFDAPFFGINPREAEIMDPQQRFFLECTWEALEDAGYNPETYQGRIGVFAAKGPDFYYQYKLHLNSEVYKHTDDIGVAVGNEKDFIATQISYRMNLTGPSINVQSACSSSMVAICMACQSLLTYQSDMVLAGGSVITPWIAGYEYREGGLASPDGHCRAFDAAAKGTVFGNGVGVVVLKRLADAIADGDQIYAVIKGFALNNDGSRKVGFTAPSIDGQAEVVAETLAMAGFSAETINYIEAHGTGTALGDPIEVAALTKAFRAYTEKKGFCGIGSVKTNIGHADTASGVAGLIKSALVLKNKQIPPTLHFKSPNPQIDFANSPFYVVDKLSRLEAGETPLRVGVSSFGIGGTNAHIVLEEAPELTPSGQSRPSQLLLLSAKSDSALERATDNLGRFFEKHPEGKIADIAYTLQVGRKPASHRRMLVCGDGKLAGKALDDRDPKLRTAVVEFENPSLVFLFPGQGAQFVNMGLGLYQQERPFRNAVDRCAELLMPHLGFDIRQTLYPADDALAEAAKLIGETQVTQPALFVIEYALATLLGAWGLRPHAMIGHSIGEYVAACLAGVLTLEDALRLVAIRGRLISELPRGAMLGVNAASEFVEGFLNDDLSLAAVNAPSLSVVSGPVEAVNELEVRLSAAGITHRQLHTSHAFHSAMMEPIVDRFVAEVNGVELKAPKIAYLSNVTGTWITADEATDPAYWGRHIRQTVRFSEAASELLKETERVFVEVGPGRTLQTFIKQQSDAAQQRIVVSSIRHPKDETPDQEFLLGALGELWLSGISIDWSGFYDNERRRRVSLPAYPFERYRYWVDASNHGAAAVAAPAPSGKKSDVADWFYFPSWKRSNRPEFAAGEEEARWLVFVDESGLGGRMAERLDRQGLSVKRVLMGSEFAANADGSYTINTSHRDDYNRLFDELVRLDFAPNRIVHLWSVTSGGKAASDLTSFDAAQQVGFFSLVFLAQAIGSSGIKDPIHIDVIANHVQEVTAEDELRPEKATLLGPCQVIPLEYASITCRSIDVTISKSKKQQSKLLERLIEEVTGKVSDETMVAYRGNSRWVKSYERTRVETGGEAALKLRDEGVYLITGGMGGIGLALAEYLADAVRARLALVGRSSFPERIEWESWLATHDEQNPVSTSIRTLQAMELKGAEVLVLTADVADGEQMRRVFDRVRDRFGAIHGVIHSAGVPAGGVMQLKTPDMVAGIFSPKVRGTYILDSLCKGEKLDFFLLCSSLASIVGGSGQVDYCAANIFLDVFAQRKARDGNTLVASIGWDKWEDVGMAVKAKETWPQASRTAPEKMQTEEPSAYEPVHHPLLDKLLVEGDQATFVSNLDGKKHWILSEHKVLGTPTVEGTAYVEMARAAFSRFANTETMEIKDLLFLTPLAVQDGEIAEVQLIIKKLGKDYEFQVRSNSNFTNNGAVVWREHAIGGFASRGVEEPKRFQIDEIIRRCNIREETVSTQALPEDSTHPIRLGPRWENISKVYVGDQEGLILLELAPEFSADLQDLLLHPAMLDMATSTGAYFLGGAPQFYLPLSYKSLVVKRPLGQRFYSYYRNRTQPDSNQELLKFDIVLMDEEGTELVTIEEFSLKKVGETAAQNLKEKAAVPARPVDASKNGHATARVIPRDIVKTGDIQDGMFPKEGVEVFRRILSSKLQPHIALSTTELRTRLIAEESEAASQTKEADERTQSRQAVHPRPSLRTPYAAPSNDLEQTIAEVWQPVLGIDRVGRHDNFIELGGHSLLAIRVISRIRDETQVGLPMDALFSAPTVAELAQLIVRIVSEQVDAETLDQVVAEVKQSIPTAAH